MAEENTLVDHYVGKVSEARSQLQASGDRKNFLTELRDLFDVAHMQGLGDEWNNILRQGGVAELSGPTEEAILGF
jgi:hypothetical protein